MLNKIILKNGLRLITIPVSGVETVAVLVLVGVGSRFENEKTNGLAHFTEHMLFQGTEKYPSKFSLSLEVDKIGAEFNGMTDKEYTGYFVKAESRHLNLAVDILSQMACKPLIKGEEIEREKNVILQEIAMREDMPQVKAIDSLWEMVFNGNPLGLSGAGEKRSILGFKKDNFLSFRESYYRNDNTVVIVLGKFEEKEVLDLVENKFSSLSDKSGEKFKTFLDKQNRKLKKTISRKTDQVHLALGFPAFSRISSFRYPQALLDIILGSGMSSRLFQKIREEKSLAYYVGSEAEIYMDTGIFCINGGVDKKRVKEAIEAIWEELIKIKSQKLEIKNSELRKAKDYLRGKMVLRLEEPLDKAMFFGMRELLEGKMDTPDRVLEKIEKVNLEEVLHVAKEIFKEKKSSLVIVGDY